MKDLELYANTTFTQSEVRKIVDGFIGDFVGMQEYLETFQVRGGAISTLSGHSITDDGIIRAHMRMSI